MHGEKRAPHEVRVGVVYLLHFAEPYFHARHYAGFSCNLAQRLRAHRAGRGARLMAAVAEAEIRFVLVRTWDNVTQAFERRLHRNRHLVEMCPICTTRWLRPLRPRRDPATGLAR